jgi:hypothetical protein
MPLGDFVWSWPDHGRGETVTPVEYLSKQEGGMSGVAKWTRQGHFVL